MELSKHVVDFEKRSVTKSEILANFVVEWMDPAFTTEGAVSKSPWLVCCDGAWEAVGDGVAAILTSPSGIKQRYIKRLQFRKDTDKCTNSIIEYEVILLGQSKLRAIWVQRCILCTDSKVVAKQIEKECIAREPTLEKYLALVRRMEFFSRVSP
jgi:ribonuclease HI